MRGAARPRVDHRSDFALADRGRPTRPRQTLVTDVPKLVQKDAPGFYRGKHYTAYVGQVTALLQKEQLRDAEALLLQLVAAVEAEETVQQHSRAPWYTAQLASIYRQQRYADEVAILERYDRRSEQSSLAIRIAQAKVHAEQQSAEQV
jgi:hypothetical protein